MIILINKIKIRIIIQILDFTIIIIIVIKFDIIIERKLLMIIYIMNFIYQLILM